MAPSTVTAQTYWDGGGGNNRWNTRNNWSNNSNPGSGTTVILDNSYTTLPTTIQLRGNRSVNILQFATNDNVDIVNGTGSRTLNLYSGQVSTSGSGNFAFSFNRLDLRANGVFDINGTGSFDISAEIRDNGGSRSFTKNGTGTLTFSRANSYTGTTTVNAGTLLYGVDNVIDTGAVTVSGGTLDLGASHSDTVGTVTLASGNITGTGTSTLTSTGSFALQSGNVSARLGGAGINLNKTTSGTVNLSGANTYTGSTTVSAGVLNIQNNSALGTSAGGTTVASGAALEMQGGITVSGESLTLSGTGVSSNGALRNVSGSNTSTGNITLAANTEIQSDAGSLTLSGNISGATRNLTIDGAGATTISGVIGTTSGNLTKNGAGTLTLSNTNTYTGGTTVNAGTLELTTGGGAGAIRGNLTVNAGGTVNASATDAFGYSSGNQVTNVTVNGGTINNNIASPNGNLGWGNAYSLSNGALLSSNGGVSDATATSNFTLGNGSTVQATAGTSTIAGRVNLRDDSSATNYDFTVDGGANLNVTAGISSSGTVGFTKLGTGTMTLSGANTYSGTTTVSAGTLTANSNGALGATGGATTVSSGATLAIGGGVTIDKSSSTLSIAGEGTGAGVGALRATGAAGTTSYWNGDVTLTGDTTFTASDNQLVVGDGYNFDTTISLGSNTLTLNTTSATGVATTFESYPSYLMDDTNLIINSVITGTGGLTKTGAGTATLNYYPVVPTTAYTGDTVITGGKLIIDGTESDEVTYNPVINSTNVYVGNSSSPGSADSVVLQLGQLASPAAANYMIGTYDEGTNTASTNLTVYEDGLFNMNGASNRFNNLTLQGGHVSGGDASYSPLLTIAGGVTTLASAQTAVIDEGEVGMSGNGFTFNVADGAAATDLRIDSVLHNGIGFTAADSADSMVKTGAGTLALTAANDYQGVTSIDQGIVNISNDSALGQYGPSLGSLNNGTTVASGAQLQLSNNITVDLESLSLNGTGISNTGALLNESGDNTYKGYVYLDGDARINANSGTTLEIGNYTGPGDTLNVNGGIMNGASAGKNLTVGGTGDTTVNGGIGSYVNNITKDGSGTLTLAGNNSYTGATSVTSGAVKVTHSNGLSGTGATVADGAALQFAQNASNADINVIGVASTIQGTGLSNGGAIQNLNGNNSYAGNITLANDARITANTGSSLTMTGSVTGAGHNLDAGGLGNTTYQGVISGSGTAVTKTDAGTVTFSGSGANTFTGGLNVNDGTLNLNKTGSANAVGTGTVTVGDSSGSALSANLALQANNQMADTTNLVLNSDGRIQMGTSADAIRTIAGTGQIDLGTGTINMGTGATTGGKLTIGADNSSSTFSGDITGSGTLEKLGSGTLELDTDPGNISYAGNLILGGGTLKLTDIDLTVGNLLITADTVLDFSGASTLFASTFSFLNTSITLNIINWTKNTDFFYSTNWTGATQDILDNMGSLPESQVVFAGWDANNTGWDSWDDQIYPNVPEPSTYGALFLGLCSALVFWRKKARSHRPKA